MKLKKECFLISWFLLLLLKSFAVFDVFCCFWCFLLFLISFVVVVEWTVVRMSTLGLESNCRWAMPSGKTLPIPQRTIGCGVLRAKFKCTFLRGGWPNLWLRPAPVFHRPKQLEHMIAQNPKVGILDVWKRRWRRSCFSWRGMDFTSGPVMMLRA